MDLNKLIENVALLYCIAITSYWKPHTVRSYLAQHQSDDRYTKCTEHLYTLSLGNAACACTAVACQIYVG